MSGPGRLRPVRGVGSAALLGGLALTCGVALTTTSGWLIVSASYRPQILTLLAAIVLVRAFGIARPALRYAERIRSHDAALRFLARERARTYARLIPLTPARLGRRSRGDLLAGVVDDLDDIAYAQVRVVVPIVALGVAGLLAALADAMLLWPAAAVTLSLVVLTVVVARVDLLLETRAQGELVAARAEVSQQSALISGMTLELRAVGAEQDALARLDAAQDRLRRALVGAARGRALGVAAMPVLTAAHAVAMAAVVRPWVTVGLAGPLAAFLLLTPIALGEVVAGLPDAVGALARARGSVGRLETLLAQRPAVLDPAAAPGTSATTGMPEPPATAGTGPGATGTPDLGLHRVSASWDGVRAALETLDADIPAGTRLAIVGPNGCGKSTLLAVLARHLDPSAGTYLMGGVRVTDLPLAQSRGPLAVVDDEPHVFASTLRENLRLARPDATDADLDRALRLAGLGGWYAGLGPTGLATPLGATGQGVSGGERARLAIARALLSERPVLLLDEPVAHLDHPTATAVLADLWEAAAGRTVVLVAHRNEGVADADRVLRLGRPERVAPPPVAGPR